MIWLLIGSVIGGATAYLLGYWRTAARNAAEARLGAMLTECKAQVAELEALIGADDGYPRA